MSLYQESICLASQSISVRVTLGFKNLHATSAGVHTRQPYPLHKASKNFHSNFVTKS